MQGQPLRPQLSEPCESERGKGLSAASLALVPPRAILCLSAAEVICTRWNAWNLIAKNGAQAPSKSAVALCRVGLGGIA